MTKLIINSINRVEGTLKVELDIDNKRVVNVKCQAINYRGIEEILQGRDPRDSIYFTSRTSGTASFSHGLAASIKTSHFQRIKNKKCLLYMADNYVNLIQARL